MYTFWSIASILLTVDIAKAKAHLYLHQKQVTVTAEPDNLLDQGVKLYRSERHLEAIQVWQQALLNYQESGNRSGEGKILSNLGLAYRELEKYSQAIEYYQQSLTIQEEIGDLKIKRRILGNLGNIYAIIGQYERALDYQTQSLELALASQDRTAERRALANLGAIHTTQSQYEAAIEYYQQSLSIAQELDNVEAEAIVLCNLGSTYNSWKQDYELAIDYFQQCLDQAKTSGNRWLAAEALSSIGFAYEGLESFELAMDYYDQGIAAFQAIDSLPSATVTLNNRAHTLLKWSDTRTGGDVIKLQEAESNLRQAIQMLDDIRNNQVSLDADRVSIFDTQVMTYNLLQQVLIAQGQPEKALEISEEGRAQALAILLKEKQPATNTFNLAQIQQFAQDQNATLVEYSIVPEDNMVHQGKARGKAAGLYIWVVQPNGKVDFRQVDLTDHNIDLAKTVQLSLATIGVRSRGSLVNVAPDEADHTEQLRTLHQILIEPIVDLLPQSPTEPVIFIPQNELFLVPFPALLADDDVYLIQRHTILSAPSIQVLQLAQKSQGIASPTLASLSAKDFLIVGNPEMPTVWDPTSGSQQTLARLPGAETEALTVATLFDSVPLINNQATEQRVKQHIADATVIHLATHGLLEYGNPQGSGIQDTPGAIALTPDADNDGLLTAAEIAELELTADLVVLSACDTGLGQITGDGVIGLSRSLLQAGAANVIVSLWSVPDAPTADLMTEFYRQLRQGEGKAQALRQAMLATIDTHPDPEDWAAFTLIGSVN